MTRVCSRAASVAAACVDVVFELLLMALLLLAGAELEPLILDDAAPEIAVVPEIAVTPGIVLMTDTPVFVTVRF